MLVRGEQKAGGGCVCVRIVGEKKGGTLGKMQLDVRFSVNVPTFNGFKY